jgi:hypothetical protein
VEGRPEVEAILAGRHHAVDARGRGRVGGQCGQGRRGRAGSRPAPARVGGQGDAVRGAPDVEGLEEEIWGGFGRC